MSIRGSRVGARGKTSYDPSAWAEKKRTAIERAEKLKVERRKMKEAARDGVETEALLEVHDNVK
ncbi:hypothetical protein Pmar_PMAR007810 [Perkinsus marinus ATCC 50983]|uniref:Uncharacterized protein n=1 Tax=Perkinsus marinus (strain ATCC 50983 / TXsc) TaxID=423536 RepID=C5LUU5_PERM5|nr:hypothetical protein Pmar_PMAR007810 [Perkinsus marinus ATCC 50983]EEQ99497.1 hypothetical protein Pmar_PMAR007810 [Perkinsus marinus ATCC 50983]|eukprot:XP_002766780.1 hypothetical protein Pmar_PMAR007810 [Perkinsus marinus ATCC 50983]